MIGRRAHDPERDAALYVSGEMRPTDRGRFEAHLLGCDRCWMEVSAGREGRGIAEASREIAPVGLRDEIRSAITLAATPRQRRKRNAVVSAAVIVSVSIVVAVTIDSRGEPAPIDAAVAAARTQTLAAVGPAARPAPDLASEGLHLVIGGRVDLSGLSSDAFMYRDATGQVVLLFTSDSPFPVARDATAHPAAGTGWAANTDGLTLICGDRPTNYLVVAQDPSLVGLVERAFIGTSSLR
jgi:anti-sigma factor RsiW